MDGDAHDRHVGERELRSQAGALHVLAADAEEVDAPLALRGERAHQLAAQRIARMLAGDEENAQVVAAGGGAALADAARRRRAGAGGAIGEAHGVPPVGAAKRNSPLRSASAIPCARSPGVRPITAMPARCAAAAADMTEARSAATASETTATAERRAQRRRPHWRRLPERAMSEATPSPHSMAQHMAAVDDDTAAVAKRLQGVQQRRAVRRIGELPWFRRLWHRP